MLLTVISITFSSLISLLILVVYEAKKYKKEKDCVVERRFSRISKPFSNLSFGDFKNMYEVIDNEYVSTKGIHMIG